ncbi:MAG: C2H2-type zinc finger protein [Candidatus Omnitrophica bacterium]|nr:C2H2-type zinc finger protein [Candidatus Omnitrophota bacterium]
MSMNLTLMAGLIELQSRGLADDGIAVCGVDLAKPGDEYTLTADDFDDRKYPAPEPPKPTLKCFHCDRPFKTDDGLKRHVETKHLQPSIK